MCVPVTSTGLLGALAFAARLPATDAWSDRYLLGILARERVDDGPFSAVHQAHRTLAPIITRWAHIHLGYLALSGSFAKGTANRSSTDVDLLVSLQPTCSVPLSDIYQSLREALGVAGYKTSPQSVSIGVALAGLQIDVVPARQHSIISSDHSIFVRRRGTWRKANIDKHIRLVRNSGCTEVVRIIKLWRDQRGFEFPSFYLELSVIRALETCWFSSLSHRVVTVLQYLAHAFAGARFEDPANAANIVSDDLTASEKQRIQREASASLLQPWSTIVR